MRTAAGIYGFAVGANCSLTALAGSPFETDLNVHDDIFVHPSRECLLTSPGIQVFDLEPEDGGLTYLAANGVDLESSWDLETLSADGDIAITLSHSSSGDSFGVYAFDSTTRTITEQSYSPVQTPNSNYGSLLLVDVPQGGAVLRLRGGHSDCIPFGHDTPVPAGTRDQPLRSRPRPVPVRHQCCGLCQQQPERR